MGREFNLLEMITKFLILAPAILLALTVHELAHAFAAWRMGDPTAKNLGRVSLNPIRHLDPMGSLVFLITAWAGMGFGWARPVPVNYLRMKNIRMGFIVVSAAGPLANIITALLLSLLVLLAAKLQWLAFFEYNIINFALTSAYVNAILAFFNLLPLPPLDGSGVVTGLLPVRLAKQYQKVGRYGIFILFALLALTYFSSNLNLEMPDIFGTLVRDPAKFIINMFFPRPII